MSTCALLEETAKRPPCCNMLLPRVIRLIWPYSVVIYMNLTCLGMREVEVTWPVSSLLHIYLSVMWEVATVEGPQHSTGCIRPHSFFALFLLLQQQRLLINLCKFTFLMHVRKIRLRINFQARILNKASRDMISVFTESLIPLSRILLEKPAIAQPLRNCPPIPFFIILKLIIMFTRANQFSYSESVDSSSQPTSTVF
jgi:hypothetical protein